MLNINLNRKFQGRPLRLVNIKETEQAAPGQILLFEVVSGGWLRRFQQGFLISVQPSPGPQLAETIRQYRLAYPKARLYISGGR